MQNLYCLCPLRQHCEAGQTSFQGQHLDSHVKDMRSCLCHRYENIKKHQAAKLKDSHERNMQLLKSQERPFSFYGKALAKEESAKKYRPPSAQDFQQPFKANPIPKSSLEVS